LHIPLSLDIPERLQYIRNTLQDIIDQYEINNAFIRINEGMYSVKSHDIERYNIEGVILECVAGCDIVKYKYGKIVTMERLLGLEKGDFKDLAYGKEIYEVPSELDWANGLSKEERESILACNAALNL